MSSLLSPSLVKGGENLNPFSPAQSHPSPPNPKVTLGTDRSGLDTGLRGNIVTRCGKQNLLFPPRKRYSLRPFVEKYRDYCCICRKIPPASLSPSLPASSRECLPFQIRLRRIYPGAVFRPLFRPFLRSAIRLTFSTRTHSLIHSSEDFELGWENEPPCGIIFLCSARIYICLLFGETTGQQVLNE